MNRLLKNKFLQVGLPTSCVIIALLVYSWYLIHFFPYHNGYRTAVEIREFIVIGFFVVLLLSNLYSVIYFPIAKLKRKSLHPSVIIGPSIMISFILMALLKPYLPEVLPSGSHLRTFDSEVWIGDQSTVPQKGITIRQEMLGDLVENVLPGKSRNEVIRLLGLPSENGTIDRILGISNENPKPPVLYFFLGPERGENIHIEFLVTFFDATSHYEKYSIKLDD